MTTPRATTIIEADLPEAASFSSWKERLLMAPVAKFWSTHRIASTSLALCALEIIIVWGAVAFVQLQGQHAVLVTLASIAWLCGGVTSIMSAIAALIIDPRREIGAMVMIVAVVAFLICGLPFLV